jgi:hypothetical protein
LNSKASKKRHAKEQRRPALLPLPEGLALLLELANLIPVYLRHPYWARRREEEREDSKFAWHEEDILHWQWKEESQLSKVARWIEQDVPEEGRFNTPYLLWVYMYAALEEFPLPLKAFILHDQHGEEREVNGRLVPISIDPDYQARINIFLIRRSREELIELCLKAVHRIEARIKEEEEKAGKLVPDIHYDSATLLLDRTRERLILALGIQDLFSCLIHPEEHSNLFYGSMYYQSSAAISHFYLNKEGKISFTPSPLARVLEGIDVARIKECLVCYKYFWAGRKDMRCCSSQCSHTLRQRNYRERYLQSYKEQRYKKAEVETMRQSHRVLANQKE